MVTQKHTDQGWKKREENKNISYNHLFKYYTKKCNSTIMGLVLLLLEEMARIWLRFFFWSNSVETVYLQSHHTKEWFGF